MDPKWTLSLLAAILHTVASAPESVFALEGNSVTLIMQRNNNMDIDDAIWVFNQSCDVVRYYPHRNKLHQLRITDTYKGRVEFDRTIFSLELTNPRKNDSGLYKGEINAEGRKAVSEYRLNVLEQVAVPVLTVESVSSSGDLCNVTVTCRAGDLSLTSTCDISTCTQEEQTAPSSLAISIKDGVIICNHSNPVSWHHATVELERLCQSTQQQEFNLGDEQAPLWICVPVALGLILLVICGVLCFGMHLKNQAGSSPKVYQSVGDDEMFSEKKQSEVSTKIPSPSSDVKRRTPFKSRTPSSVVVNVSQGFVPTELSLEKKQSEVVCAKTTSPSSDVKLQPPSKSRTPSSVVVNLSRTLSLSSAVKRQTPYKYGTPSSNAVVHLLQTPRPSSAVKRRTPFKSRSPPSYAVVDLSQTPSPSSVVGRRTPFKSRSPYSVVVNLSQTPSSSSAVKRRTPFKSISPPSYAVVDLSQTQTPSSVVKRRTPFKSKSQSKAKENLLQTLSPSPAVKKQTPSIYGTPSSNTVENLLQTPSPSSAVRRRTPFKSRSQSKAKKNLSQKY